MIFILREETMQVGGPAQTATKCRIHIVEPTTLRFPCTSITRTSITGVVAVLLHNSGIVLIHMFLILRLRSTFSLASTEENIDREIGHREVTTTQESTSYIISSSSHMSSTRSTPAGEASTAPSAASHTPQKPREDQGRPHVQADLDELRRERIADFFHLRRPIK